VAFGDRAAAFWGFVQLHLRDHAIGDRMAAFRDREVTFYGAWDHAATLKHQFNPVAIPWHHRLAWSLGLSVLIQG